MADLTKEGKPEVLGRMTPYYLGTEIRGGKRRRELKLVQGFCPGD